MIQQNTPIDRDSHVVITRSGGFAGQTTVLADVTLDKLSDADFETAKDLLTTLSRVRTQPGHGRILDGFNYRVSIGAKDVDAKSLTSLFNLRAAASAPKELAALTQLLNPAKNMKRGF